MTSGNVYRDCISGLETKLIFDGDLLTDIAMISDVTVHEQLPSDEAGLKNEVPIAKTKYPNNNIVQFIAPGLIDLQVNGINGIDFNDVSLTKEDVFNATRYLLRQGVTSFLPTLITNSEDNLRVIAGTIRQACSEDALTDSCIMGIHLEGPFLSPVPGAKGAHDEAYLKLPDWDLIERLQAVAGGKIRLLTIAPELEGSYQLIEKCRQQNILVSIGHSMANREQIDLAVKAGATLATHLGNAVPLNLPRHPNILWDLLADDKLYACIIADGLHVPDSFIKVVIKTKGDATLLVSDATRFAGMAPGEYKNHIGGTVILDDEKRVKLKSTPGLLAGAAKTLLENVETLVERNLATLADAWKMGSLNVSRMLTTTNAGSSDESDFVVFEQEGNAIRIKMVIKNRYIVFQP